MAQSFGKPVPEQPAEPQSPNVIGPKSTAEPSAPNQLSPVAAASPQPPEPDAE